MDSASRNLYTADAMGGRTAPRDLLLLAALLAAVAAVPLAVPPITNRGEAREAMIIRDVVRNGHWVLGHRLGVVASKPPLYHWIGAAAARVAGLSDVTVRLPSLLAAYTMLAATMIVGGRLAGRRGGWLAVGALAGMLAFWETALEARVDMLFAAAITVALGGFLGWYLGGRTRPPSWLYAGALAAILAKGPAGAALPAAVVLAFLASRRELALIGRLWSWGLAALVVLGAGGWYLAALRAGGADFVAVQLERENLDRFTGTGIFRESRHRTPFKLPVSFALRLLPWNLVIPWSAWRWLRGRTADGATWFLHVWWITILVVFSLAAGKRSVYLLPAYPAVALLAGVALARARLPTRALAAVVVVIDLAAFGATQARRVAEARAETLVPFARAVLAAVPADAPLLAMPDLNENEYVTLGWLLDRPLQRSRFHCPSDAWWIAPPSNRRHPATVVAESTARSGRPIALLRCAEP